MQHSYLEAEKWVEFAYPNFLSSVEILDCSISIEYRPLNQKYREKWDLTLPTPEKAQKRYDENQNKFALTREKIIQQNYLALSKNVLKFSRELAISASDFINRGP